MKHPLFFLVLSLCLVSSVSAGTGTEADPYTIAEAKALPESAAEYYAQGYIVGGRYDNFDAPWDNDFGVSAADSDTESDVNNCLQVKLEADGGRTSWGLNSNPGKLGTFIKFKGYRDSYGGYDSFEGIDNADISEVSGSVTSNEPPTISLSPSGTNKSVLVSNTLSFTVTAYEPAADDGETVTLWATNLPSGATFSTVSHVNAATNDFSWEPALSQTGTHNVVFLAGDTNGTNTLTVQINVSQNGDGQVLYHAVIAGISDYEGSINDLNYCDDDAQDIYDRLLDSPNWDSSRMQLLKDSQATEANIQSAISTMASAADADDVCLFFFSGHGGQESDEAPSDESDGYDEAIYPYYIQSNYILDDELSDWLGALETDKLIVWIDTCHSGGQLKQAGRQIKCVSWAPNQVGANDGFLDDLQLLKKDINDLNAPYISTACDDDEYSIEDSYLQQGLYTYYLLEALDNADADVSGWVSGEESFDYLYSRVVDYESTQHPQEYDAYPGQADVVRSGSATDLPTVSITNPAAPSITVNNTNDTVDIQGTCNTSVVGQLSWTNSLTASNGTFAAATAWTLADVYLDVGNNVITLSGTNINGEADTDSVSVRRLSALEGNLLISEGFDESTDAPAGWTDGGTDNDTSIGHIQSSPNCRALGPGDTLETPAVNNPTEITFYVDASSGGDGQDGSIDYSVDGGAWTQLGTFTVSKDGQTEQFDLGGSPDLSSSPNVSFRFNSTFFTWYLDDVRIYGGGGSGLSITITNPASGSVANDTTNTALSGTASTNITGHIQWTNELTGAAGLVPAGTNWYVANIALNVGDNVLRVIGTNDAGSLPASDTITITRQSEGGGSCGLILSEYVEGSSNNKAVELFNGTPACIELEANNYVLQGYHNGNTSPSYTIALTGSVESLDTYVIVYTSADAGLLAYADQLTGSMNFNGDDALVLRSGGADGTVVDSFGRVGEDPGDYWGSGEDTTQDHTLRRTESVGTGDIVADDAFDPASEWNFFAQDTFAGLGSHTNTCSSGTPVEDSDGDGIPDWWENRYTGMAFLSDTNDQDSDGFTDLEEYWADTDPDDNAAYFHSPTSVTGVATFTFEIEPTTNSRVYDAWYSTNLMTSEWTAYGLSITGRQDAGAVTLTVTNTRDNAHYRTGVRMP